NVRCRPATPLRNLYFIGLFFIAFRDCSFPIAQSRAKFGDRLGDWLGRRKMAGRLTARKVATAKPGKHSDGGNLYLIVSDTGSRKWVLRFTWRGSAKEMGLGSANDVPLAEAFSKRGRADSGIPGSARGRGRSPSPDTSSPPSGSPRAGSSPLWAVG